MKTLERVKVADLHTPMDKYGNEFPSREFDQQVNKDYLRELADSFKANGEPDVALSLVRREEGGYYVADGQSRMHAMEMRGTKECWGVVDEDATVQDVIETIMRTNKKKKYEPAEESRVVQQLAAFGDDAYVSEVASIDVDKAARVRKAREMIGGEMAEQLSLDRLYVVADFDGDDDAVKAIIEASEDKWHRVADDLRRDKENAEKAAAFKEEAAAIGLKLVDDHPSGSLRYACTCREPGDLKADYMAASVKYKGIVGRVTDSWYVELTLYGKPIDGDEESEEEAERRRLRDKYSKMAGDIDDACFNWVLDTLGDGDPHEQLSCLPGLYKACRKIALGAWQVADALKLFPMAKKEKDCLVLFALGYRYARRLLSDYARELADDEIRDYVAERTGSALDWIDLHIADGFEPSDDMSEFLELARGKVAESGAEDGAGD